MLKKNKKNIYIYIASITDVYENYNIYIYIIFKDHPNRGKVLGLYYLQPVKKHIARQGVKIYSLKEFLLAITIITTWSLESAILSEHSIGRSNWAFIHSCDSIYAFLHLKQEALNAVYGDSCHCTVHYMYIQRLKCAV